MSNARMLIKQGDKIYRFMRFGTASDGSLLIFLDRDPTPRRGGMSFDNGIRTIIEDSEKPEPHARFTVHTTGEVHKYDGGVRRSTIYIEPLHAVTKLATIGFISIPRVSRLDTFDEIKHRHDVAAVLEIPENVTDRLTFIIEIGPTPQQPMTYGSAFNYEIYSAVIRIEQGLLKVPDDMIDHFVHGTITPEKVERRKIAGEEKANAELNFYQRIHGRHLHVFREDSGAYVIMAEVLMRIAPKLKIEFSRPDLSIELIPFTTDVQPMHKVRFLICDKGGRNRKNDLRKYITSIELDAEL